MRILTGIIFIANIALYILGIVIGFAMGFGFGIVVLIGFISFLVAWHLSGGMVVAPADYFFQPEWDVFKKKLKWSNGIGWGLVLFAIIILGSLGY
jgi:hypothetical protein